MMKSKALLLVLLVGLLMALAPAASRAQWEVSPTATPSATPTAIAPGTLYDNGRKLARTSDGALHTVYARFDGSYSQIYYSYSTDEGETWTEEQITSASRKHRYPSIATDSKDNIHVAWSHCQEPSWWGRTCTIQYREKTTTWQPLEDLITSYGSYPAIAVDSQDNVYVVLSGTWGGAYNCDDVKYIKRTASGWNSPEKVSTQCWARDPEIAIDKDDNVHVVYRNAPLPGPTGGIRYRQRTATGWGSEVVIEPNDSNATQPSIAIGEKNYVHVVWEWNNPSTDEWAIKYVRFTDSWQPIQILEGPSTYPQHRPSMLVDSDDELHVLWQGKHAGSPDYSQIRHRKYTNGWSPVQDLTSASQDQVTPTTMWAWWPVVSGVRTNQVQDGYAFVWVDGTTVKYYASRRQPKEIVKDIFERGPTPEQQEYLDRIIAARTPAGARQAWNQFVNRYATISEAHSDVVIKTTAREKGSYLDSALLVKLLDFMVNRETGIDADTISPLQIGKDGELGITQFTDRQLATLRIDRLAGIPGRLAAVDNMEQLRELVSRMLQDPRSDKETCLAITIQNFEWLVEHFSPRGFTFGDNRDSAEALAAGHNGGPGAMRQGFKGGGADWNSDLIQNTDARSYAKAAGDFYDADP